MGACGLPARRHPRWDVRRLVDLALMDYAAPSEREYRKYRAIAREVGVPEPFVEDAAQDIAVKLWRYPPKTNIYRKRVIRSQALDSLRRYARGGGGVLEDASVAHTFTS